MDDGANLSRCCYQDVVLRLDEKQQCNDEKPRAPVTDATLIRGLCAGVDRSENRRGAEAAHRRDKHQPAQRALHFPANELVE